MQNNSQVSSDHYDELTARQIEQYKETEVMHDLPPIYDYWASTHISWKSESVTGHTDIIAFYADFFKKSLLESNSNILISIGAGDCSIEIDVVKKLLEQQAPTFVFNCLELSPILIEKARKKINEEGLEEFINVIEVDINRWNPGYLFAGVMAHHALHHFLSLEELFSLINSNLAKNGRFVTCDIIGRNGHMRWPEAEGLTHEIWNRLPRKYKYNHQYQRFDDYFENRDCSTEGFEGIRAQDILPLLIQQFSFEVFYCYGNLIDPFVDRGFGPNFDPRNELDKKFIDYVQNTNEELISKGILKPTSMVAVMTNEKIAQPRTYKHWTPDFVVRNPDAAAPRYDVNSYIAGIPYKVQPDDQPLTAKKVRNYSLGTKIIFNVPLVPDKANIDGKQYLKYGWSDPDENSTWSTGEKAALIIPFAEKIETDVLLSLRFMVYQSALFQFSAIEVSVNDISLIPLEYDNHKPFEVHEIEVAVPVKLIKDKELFELSFFLPNRRQPQFESGDDVRPLGISLISLQMDKKNK